MGFKYRRNAGEGGFCIGGGRRSSVSSGAIVKSDRVRKSSGWTEGVVKEETDCAADLIARNDAVRFDLNEDFRRGKVRNEADCFSGITSGVSSIWTLNSIISPSSISASRSGWSKAQSSEGVYRSCRLSDGLF